MNFQNFYGVKKNLGFCSKNSILIHCFEFVSNTDSKFPLLFSKQLQMIKSGLLNEYLFVTKKDVVLLKLFEKIFVDNSLTLLFKILLSFQFAYIFMETINVVV